MFKFYSINQGVPGASGAGSLFFISLGATLLLMGIAIVIMPELLAFLIAAGIILAGATLIGFGLHLKRLEKLQSQFIVEAQRR
ncbi:MAG: hypothetical protein KDD66_11915 [Bdellovibrionales bacterium]|nr:hypothetical protein [Bdellovibrionales bacterium]